MDKEIKDVKRNGKKENISFDKILHRIKRIGKEENIKINYSALVMKIIDQLHDDIYLLFVSWCVDRSVR